MSKIKVYLSIITYDIDEDKDIWSKRYATKESISAYGRIIQEETVMEVSPDRIDGEGFLVEGKP